MPSVDLKVKATCEEALTAREETSTSQHESLGAPRSCDTQEVAWGPQQLWSEQSCPFLPVLMPSDLSQADGVQLAGPSAVPQPRDLDLKQWWVCGPGATLQPAGKHDEAEPPCSPQTAPWLCSQPLQCPGLCGPHWQVNLGHTPTPRVHLWVDSLPGPSGQSLARLTPGRLTWTTGWGSPDFWPTRHWPTISGCPAHCQIYSNRILVKWSYWGLEVTESPHFSLRSDCLLFLWSTRDRLFFFGSLVYHSLFLFLRFCLQHTASLRLRRDFPILGFSVLPGPLPVGVPSP